VENGILCQQSPGAQPICPANAPAEASSGGGTIHHQADFDDAPLRFNSEEWSNALTQQLYSLLGRATSPVSGTSDRVIEHKATKPHVLC
jgi:hypothetical protein